MDWNQEHCEDCQQDKDKCSDCDNYDLYRSPDQEEDR